MTFGVGADSQRLLTFGFKDAVRLAGDHLGDLPRGIRFELQAETRQALEAEPLTLYLAGSSKRSTTKTLE